MEPRYVIEFNKYERDNLIRALRLTKIKTPALLAKLEASRPVSAPSATDATGGSDG